MVRCAPRPQLGAMTTTDILAQLRSEWLRVGRRSSAREAARRLDERHPDLDLSHQEDLCDVVALLESTRRTSACLNGRASFVRSSKRQRP